MKITNLILIAGILLLINSCRSDDDYDYCKSLTCSPCKRVESCLCVADTGNFHCPQGIVHGFYDFVDCHCLCERGWIGMLCDQRDTNYYISFRFGTDTLALSEPIRTSSYSFFLDFKFFDFAGSLPSGSEIDTIILTDMQLLVNSYPFCTDDDTCALLEILLHSGETANAVSGFYSIDTFGSPQGVGGTFEANLQTSTGKSFFVRDGKYFLALFK